VSQVTIRNISVTSRKCEVSANAAVQHTTLIWGDVGIVPNDPDVGIVPNDPDGGNKGKTPHVGIKGNSG